MTKPQNKKCPVVLALYPNSKGIAYAIMDSPTSIVESGIKGISPFCIHKCLKHAQTYLDYFQPDLVILENTQSKLAKKQMRITNIISQICACAQKRKLNVVYYKREDIVSVFKEFNAFNKHEINGIITMCFPDYTDKRPKERKLGDPEPYRAGEFDAISLAYTHMFHIS